MKRSLGSVLALVLVAGALSACGDDDGPPNTVPTVVIAASTTEGLAPLAVTFSAALSGGEQPLTFAWDFGDGTTDTQQNPVHVFESGADTPYLVTLTVSDVGGDTAVASLFVAVGVEEAPTVTASASPESGAAPLAVDFDCAATGGNAPVAIAWSFGDGATANVGQVGHTYLAPGTYAALCTATDADGDVASDAVTITVGTNSIPEVTASAAPAQGLAPLTVEFAGVALGGDGSLTYTWAFGDGETATGELASHTYGTPGVYPVVLTVVDEDGDAGSDTVAVHVGPVDASIVATASATPTAGAAPLEVAFECAVEGGNEPIAYAWHFGDGGAAAIADPSYTYLAPGTYTATCTATDADGDSATSGVAIVVSRDAVPVVALSATPTAGQAPLPVVFVASAGGGDGVLELTWDFGDGTAPVTGPETAQAHEYALPGLYVATVTAADEDGDAASASATIVVGEPDALPAVEPSATPESGAAPLAVAFDCGASGGDAPLSVVWDFGDGAVSPVGAVGHTYLAAGTYVATCVATDADGDVASGAVAVTVLEDLVPVAAASASTVSGPAALTVDFTGTAVGGDAPLGYAWTFGDGGSATGETATHSYAAPGVYSAMLTVTDADGDADSAILTITVGQADTAPSVTVTPATAQIGAAPFALDFGCVVANGNAPLAVVWDFGDGATSTAAAVSHTYVAPGAYTASCTATDADGDVASGAVAVTVLEDPAPVAAASASTVSGPASLTVDFTGTAIGGDAPIAFTWTFGDGATGTGASVVHTYTTPGVYAAVLTATDADGDWDTAELAIVVGVADTAPAVTIDAPAAAVSGAAPFAVDFACSVANGDAPLAVVWDFGDGATSPAAAVSHTYAAAGVYTATCTATDADGDTDLATVDVTVLEDLVPVAAASASTVSGPAGLTVDFTGTAVGGDAPLGYAWTFGDGGSATGAAATHTYAAPGVYSAMLTVTDADGDADSAVLTIAVGPADTTPSVTVTPATAQSGQAPFAVSFGCTVSGGNAPVGVVWDFGDGATSPSAAVAHTYVTPGSYSARCTATDADGDVASGTVAVTVLADLSPVAAASASTLGGPASLAVTFSGSAIGGNAPITFTWTFGDGATGTGATATHTYTTPGVYAAVLTATDADGDWDTAELAIVVGLADSAPTATITAPAAAVTGAAPFQVDFACSVANGNAPVGVVWDFGDGATSPAAAVSHTYAAPGAYTATCAATDADGDTDLATVDVTVLADLSPVAAVSASTLAGPAPLAVTFTGTAIGGDAPVAFAWTFGDGGSATGASAAHTYAAAGVYTVTLTATDVDGDADTATLTVDVGGANVAASAAVATVPSPAEGPVPLSVAFTCTGGGNAPLAYHWDFGDGTTSQGPVVTHVYDAGGDYTATCTVTDADGEIASAAAAVVATLPSANAPVIEAGDVTISTDCASTGQTLVQLDAAGVQDPNGDALTYEWVFVSIPPGSSPELNSATVVNPTFVPAWDGNYVLRVFVSDGVNRVASGELVLHAGGPTAIVDVQGDGQVAAVTEPFPAPLSLVVENWCGTPVANVELRWTPQNVAVQEVATWTDPAGYTQNWASAGTVATTAAPTTMTVAIAWDPSVAYTYAFTVNPGPPAYLRLEETGNLIVSATPYDLTLTLVDAYMNPTVATYAFTFDAWLGPGNARFDDCDTGGTWKDDVAFASGQGAATLLVCDRTAQQVDISFGDLKDGSGLPIPVQAGGYVMLLEDDFEVDIGGWNWGDNCGSNGWQRGTPFAVPPHAGVAFGTRLQNPPYTNAWDWSCTSYLYRHIDTMGYNVLKADLTFWHWYDMRAPVDGNCTPTARIVGSDWSWWWAQEAPILSGDGIDCSGPAWSGDSGGWRQARADISQFFWWWGNFNLYWDFAYGTQPPDGGIGWYIDDLLIEAFVGNPRITFVAGPPFSIQMTAHDGIACGDPNMSPGDATGRVIDEFGNPLADPVNMTWDVDTLASPSGFFVDLLQGSNGMGWWSPHVTADTSAMGVVQWEVSTSGVMETVPVTAVLTSEPAITGTAIVNMLAPQPEDPMSGNCKDGLNNDCDMGMFGPRKDCMEELCGPEPICFGEACQNPIPFDTVWWDPNYGYKSFDTCGFADDGIPYACMGGAGGRDIVLRYNVPWSGNYQICRYGGMPAELRVGWPTLECEPWSNYWCSWQPDGCQDAYLYAGPAEVIWKAFDPGTCGWLDISIRPW